MQRAEAEAVCAAGRARRQSAWKEGEAERNGNGDLMSLSSFPFSCLSHSLSLPFSIVLSLSLSLYRFFSLLFLVDAARTESIGRLRIQPFSRCLSLLQELSTALFLLCPLLGSVWGPTLLLCAIPTRVRHYHRLPSAVTIRRPLSTAAALIPRLLSALA